MARSRRASGARHPVRGMTAWACSPGAPVEARRTNLTALTGPGRNSRLVRHRNGRFADSSGGKRRPEPHGHKSFRPSFSTSSVSMPTMRLPRLTRDSLEGTPGGACRPAQKDAPASWSRYMIVLPGRGGQEIVASPAQRPRLVFRLARHPITGTLPAACECVCSERQYWPPLVAGRQGCLFENDRRAAQSVLPGGLFIHGIFGFLRSETLMVGHDEKFSTIPQAKMNVS